MTGHKLCPICKLFLSENTYINQYCQSLDKDMCYKSSLCFALDHEFSQITDLYQNLLSQKVSFQEQLYSITINYVLNCSIIEFYNESDLSGLPQIIELPKIIPMDYPDLTQVLKKIKTLALFK